MTEIKWQEAPRWLLERWDELIDDSTNGTLFHKRSFLAYHGKKYQNKEKFLYAGKGSEPVALLSLAVDESDQVKIARSPYGGSYGGIVFIRPPSYSLSSKIATALTAWLKSKNVERCLLTHPIDPCAPRCSATPFLALHEQGFKLKSRDISSVVSLHEAGSLETNLDSNCKKNYRKAKRNGVTVENEALLNDFWPLMEATFLRHLTNPTHNKNELRYLSQTLPQAIQFTIARHQGEPVAGLAEFVITNQLTSSFYLCMNSQGARCQALTLLLVKAMEKAKGNGALYYDLGTSSVGMKARPNIFRFKEGFGCEGVFRETLEWKA